LTPERVFAHRIEKDSHRLTWDYQEIFSRLDGKSRVSAPRFGSMVAAGSLAHSPKR